MNAHKPILFMSVMLILMHLSACITAGTHGSIKSYKYPVSKATLQGAIDKVIARSLTIEKQDTTTKNYIIDSTRGTSDTIISRRPNAEAYVSIVIRKENITNEYTFQYVGDERYWQSEITSELSIAYAHDKNGDGGSEGNGDFPWYNPALKKDLVSLFESELIEPVDSELGVKHVEQ